VESTAQHTGSNGHHDFDLLDMVVFVHSHEIGQSTHHVDIDQTMLGYFGQM
jgi:hypothetical protein